MLSDGNAPSDLRFQSVLFSVHSMVVLPYIKRVTEQLKRVFAKHKFATLVKPHQTLWNILVHPKDKIKTEDESGVVYRVSCKNCKQVYIGETGGKLSISTKEHKAEVDELPSSSETRAARKDSTTIRHRSAICDHVHQQNHIIDWGKSLLWTEKRTD